VTKPIVILNVKSCLEASPMSTADKEKRNKLSLIQHELFGTIDFDRTWISSCQRRHQWMQILYKTKIPLISLHSFFIFTTSLQKRNL